MLGPRCEKDRLVGEAEERKQNERWNEELYGELGGDQRAEQKADVGCVKQDVEHAPA